MNWPGFEPTISAFERAKTVHALDRAATVIGFFFVYTLLKITVTTAHKTKSSMSAFACCCLVAKLIWLTLHNWARNYWTLFWILLRMNCSESESWSLARIHGNCLLILLTWKARSVPSQFPRIRHLHRKCVSEPLCSNGLFRLSGVMSQYH
jgi:hypothetical protein